MSAGYGLACYPEEADLILINTCAFLREAEEESIETILEMAEYKRKGRCRTLVVTGCLPGRRAGSLKEALPEVDLFIQPDQIALIPRLLKKAHKVADPIFHPAILSLDKPRVLTGSRSSAFVKIADGCSNRCAYCTIPSIRGPLKSRTPSSIVKEVRELASCGVLEINLVAQDIASFGQDRGLRCCLASFLRRLASIEGIRWIRLMYCHPVHIDEQLIITMAEEEKVCRYLDIPIQHINDKILSRMNRRIGKAQITTLLRRIREAIPDIHLRTTIMVGFPGEGEREFEELLEFLESARFEKLGAFKYSREEGTPAYRYRGQVPEPVKEERYQRVMELQSKISLEKNRALVGTYQDVLIEESIDGPEISFRGRASFQAPEIDGYVMVSGGNPRVGSIVPVLIRKAGPYDLEGEILGQDPR